MSKTFFDYGIKVRRDSGQEKTLCPKCSHDRKKKNDPCLSVNVDEGIWNCHNCGWHGVLKEGKYIRPSYQRNEPRQEHLQWFEGRGISKTTIDIEGISSREKYGKLWIDFPYYKHGIPINVKSRTVDKEMRQVRDAEKIFYRADAIERHDVIIITEGEMDALSYVEAGFDNVVSVPDGAPNVGSKLSDKQFSYLISAEDHILNSEHKTFILSLDNDENGLFLRDELARRIGKDRCYMVRYPDGYKDTNEVLQHMGKDGVRSLIENKVPYPVEGIVEFDSVIDLASELLENQDTGVSTGWRILDEHYRISKCEVTSVTGIPNHGKSEWLDSLMLNLVQLYDWKFALFSAENMPVEYHALKLSGKFVQKPTIGNHAISKAQLNETMRYLKDYIHFIGTQEDSVTLESILNQARICKYRYGIDGLIIDPWNTIEHGMERGEQETAYVSRALSKLTTFAKMYDVHIWVMAHPRKIEERDGNGDLRVPSPYDISGSAHWFNKSDNCITVYRRKIETEPDRTEIHVKKVRHQWKNGVPGMKQLLYDTHRGNFTPFESQEEIGYMG